MNPSEDGRPADRGRDAEAYREALKDAGGLWAVRIATPAKHRAKVPELGPIARSQCLTPPHSICLAARKGNG